MNRCIHGCDMAFECSACLCDVMSRRFPRCGMCGGEVRLIAREGRFRVLRRGESLPIPGDVEIPTCSNCGEEFMTPEISNVLDRRLREMFPPLATCSVCKTAIRYDGEVWSHVQAAFRHRAVPFERCPECDAGNLVPKEYQDSGVRCPTCDACGAVITDHELIALLALADKKKGKTCG